MIDIDPSQELFKSMQAAFDVESMEIKDQMTQEQVLESFDSALTLFSDEFLQIFDEKPLFDVLNKHHNIIKQKVDQK